MKEDRLRRLPERAPDPKPSSWTALSQSIHDRLQWADERQLGDILAYVEKVLSATPPGPPQAPEIWRPRGGEKRETPPAFVARVYGPYLDGRFTRRDLRRLDPACAKALENWIHRNGAPEDLNLPTLSQRNDHLLAAVGDEAEGLRTAQLATERLRSATRRRNE